MATATPEPTPNPNALKFQLDVALEGTINVSSPGDAADGFTRAVMATEGVASVFGVNDFVTVTRRADADWDPIVEAVQAAAAEHL
jgi:hypothetical protein